jgi:hypothetical protein
MPSYFSSTKKHDMYRIRFSILSPVHVLMQIKRPLKSWAYSNLWSPFTNMKHTKVEPISDLVLDVLHDLNRAHFCREVGDT